MSQLELNKGDNFIFCLDVSASMGASDCPGNMSRIEFAKQGPRRLEPRSVDIWECAGSCEDGRAEGLGE